MVSDKHTFNVLIVEDDLRVAQLISLYLKQDGHHTEIATTGRDGMELFADNAPDIVILDLMLPEMDGYEICRRLRKESEVPILMLTARISEDDKLRGLNLGADDYITKPFSPREVVARVYAIMRRYAIGQGHKLSKKNEVTYGVLTIDFKKQDVQINEAWASLSPTEFNLVKVLTAHAGEVVSRHHLQARLAANKDNHEGNSLAVHISNIRSKLGKNAKGESFIKSIYGEGYRLDCSDGD